LSCRSFSPPDRSYDHSRTTIVFTTRPDDAPLELRSFTPDEAPLELRSLSPPDDLPPDAPLELRSFSPPLDDLDPDDEPLDDLPPDERTPPDEAPLLEPMNGCAPLEELVDEPVKPPEDELLDDASTTAA